MTDRTIAVAVDGMEPSLLSKWIEAGELPNFEEIQDEGAFGTASCSSLSSAKQWATHFTGVSADKHGVDGFTKGNQSRRAGDDAPDVRELVNLSDIQMKTYPELLNEAGYSVGLLNPLSIWPPLKFDDGFCVSGMLTPPNTDRWVFPKSLEKELEALDYRIDVQHGDRPYGFVDDSLFDEVDLSTLHTDMFGVLDARIEATKQMLRDRPTDYFYVLLKSVDIIQHCFWVHMENGHPEYENAILESYRRVDDLLGWILAELDANHLVFSDHGFQARQEGAPGPLGAAASYVDERFSVPDSVQSLYSRVFKSPADVVMDRPDQTSGVHANPGAWLASGPDISAAERSRATFEDLTATVLALAEHPIPTAYVGKPLDVVDLEVLNEDVDLSVRRSLSVEENEVVSSRLHNLGYAEMVDESD